MKNKDKSKGNEKVAHKEPKSAKKQEKNIKTDDTVEELDQVSEPKEEVQVITDDRFLRLQADFENFKKRVLREKSEIYQRANESIMEDLLPVLDHMDLALAATDHLPEGDSFVEGIKLVADQMLAALAKHGLQVVDAAGQPFDPNIHEAVSHIPSDEYDENVVMTQLRRGYRLGKLLLRPAQVVVSSGSLVKKEEQGL